MVSGGLADWPHRNKLVIVKASVAKCSGGWPALHKSAIDKHPSYAVGGLTRTEHKPNPKFFTYHR